MERFSAGEFGRDHEESRGEELRRIDCKIGFAIVLSWGDEEDGVEEERRRRGRWMKYA